jgi:hypothetical protein
VELKKSIRASESFLVTCENIFPEEKNIKHKETKTKNLKGFKLAPIIKLHIILTRPQRIGNIYTEEKRQTTPAAAVCQ